MRLFNIHTHTFREFHGENIPPYLIASHRWTDDETTFKDVLKNRNKASTGWRKIEAFCERARRDNELLESFENATCCEWIWIDTACIDKRSSAEVSESINSMFAWYSGAQECHAYLADVKPFPASQQLSEVLDDFKNSEWFKRGWTLQELLAPRCVVFFTQTWQIIGHKCADCNIGQSCEGAGPLLNAVITEVTGIPEEVLSDYGRSKAVSVEEKMRWQMGRRTTRIEDRAYCLLGLFGVHMPLLYGEGENAMLRLERTVSEELERPWRSHVRLIFNGSAQDEITSGTRNPRSALLRSGRPLAIMPHSDIEGEVACICGFDDDDGWLVACDICQYWQHAVCYFPETDGQQSMAADQKHRCIRCCPRDVDAAAAARHQREKRTLYGKLADSVGMGRDRTVSLKRKADGNDDVVTVEEPPTKMLGPRVDAISAKRPREEKLASSIEKVTAKMAAPKPEADKEDDDGDVADDDNGPVEQAGELLPYSGAKGVKGVMAAQPPSVLYRMERREPSAATPLLACQTSGLDMFRGASQEPFPSLNLPNPADQGLADQMNPPEINIDYAPPQLGQDRDALSPPVRALNRYARKREHSPSLQPDMQEADKLSTFPPISQSARGDDGSLGHARASDNESDQRQYILDLPKRERSHSNSDDRTGRVQKHPANFQCHLCPKCFSRAYDLRSHLQTHTDKRPFVCSVCGEAFVRQHDRKRHEASHSGVNDLGSEQELSSFSTNEPGELIHEPSENARDSQYVAELQGSPVIKLSDTEATEDRGLGFAFEYSSVADSVSTPLDLCSFVPSPIVDFNVQPPETITGDAPDPLWSGTAYTGDSLALPDLTPAHMLPYSSLGVYSRLSEHHEQPDVFPPPVDRTSQSCRRSSVPRVPARSHYMLGSASPYPYSAPVEAPVISSTGPEGRCPVAGCGRRVENLREHMREHRADRPEKCPVPTCDYHTRGFARRYDKDRHVLTHYKGEMSCPFCSAGEGQGQAVKTFSRADVFKRHLTAMHGVQQRPLNHRHEALGSDTQEEGSSAVGECSLCSLPFATAQSFYDHLDDCVTQSIHQQNQQSGSESYTCSHAECAAAGVEFRYQKDLERHMRMRHGEGEVEMFACPVEGCERVFSRKDKMLEHQRVGHGVEIKRRG